MGGHSHLKKLRTFISRAKSVTGGSNKATQRIGKTMKFTPNG